MIFPPLAGPYGCMHIKLFLLWYPESLRVVIPSANLLPFDWDTIENVRVHIFRDFDTADGLVARFSSFQKFTEFCD